MTKQLDTNTCTKMELGFIWLKLSTNDFLDKNVSDMFSITVAGIH